MFFLIWIRCAWGMYNAMSGQFGHYLLNIEPVYWFVVWKLDILEGILLKSENVLK